MSETDERFIDRMEHDWVHDRIPNSDDAYRLFALARRVAEAADEIERLRAALREIDQQRYTGRHTINPDNAYEMAVAINTKLLAVMDIARAALKEKSDAV